LGKHRVLRIYRLFLFLQKERKVKEKSELIIPVSCTEQGRWSYQTDEFFNSENIMSFKIRGKKAANVTDSLKESGSYHSDQGAIWMKIENRDRHPFSV
jgi:hypothetical protein